MNAFDSVFIDDDPIDLAWALAQAHGAMRDAVSAFRNVEGGLHEIELDLRRWESDGVRALRASLRGHLADVESERAFVQHMEWTMPWRPSQ